jgi:hypothetical protein
VADAWVRLERETVTVGLVADTVAFDGPDCCWPGPGRNPCPPYPSAVNVRSPMPAAVAVTLPVTCELPHERKLRLVVENGHASRGQFVPRFCPVMAKPVAVPTVYELGLTLMFVGVSSYAVTYPHAGGGVQ